MQEHLNPDEESFVFMPEFGHHVNKRRLIIVWYSILVEEDLLAGIASDF